MVVPLPASAAARAFEPLYIDEMNGDVMMRGNTLLTCPAADVGSTGVPCAAAQAGDGRNEHFAMTYVDIDGDPGTFSSSSATVTLPPGATVKYAVLTWGAVTVAGSGGSAPPNLASRDVVKLKVPGSSDYETVQAGLLDSINAIYQGVADVTDAVRQAGTGTYTVADVQAGTGNDRYAAWSLTVLYEDRTQPRRHLSILTGFQNSASNLGRVTVPVSEVVTPDQGPFVTRVGVMAYEGDRGLADRISLDATPLGNESNPASDVLNSSITTWASR